MLLKEQIYNDRNAARKGRDSVSSGILTLVKGEIETIETRTGKKAVDDAEVIKIVKKLIDACTETGDNVEAAVLERYVPKQLSKDQINTIMDDEFDDSVPNKGVVFKFFKDNFTGQYDGNMVKEVYGERYE